MACEQASQQAAKVIKAQQRAGECAMTSQAIGLYPDRHKSRQMSELMRLRASDLRELAEKNARCFGV